VSRSRVLPIGNGIPAGQTAIEAAMARENVELVRYFLDQGADVQKLDKNGCTLLHFACKIGTIIDLYALISIHRT
jgi:ankyrin repeat protein